MGSFFGTDGFRGEANVFLTAEHAFRLGCFLGEYCRSRTAAGESCRAVIGKDARRSSYMFEYALAAGLTASGADACLRVPPGTVVINAENGAVLFQRKNRGNGALLLSVADHGFIRFRPENKIDTV